LGAGGEGGSSLPPQALSSRAANTSGAASHRRGPGGTGGKREGFIIAALNSAPAE
jgi:hypothetical protein